MALNRSIWHVDAVPEVLISTFPNHRVLSDKYVYFSSWADTLDNTLEYDYQDFSGVDEEGATMDMNVLVGSVATLMYSDYQGEIRLSNAQSAILQHLPQWGLFLGAYEDKDLLLADATAIGVTLDASKDLADLIIDAKTALAVALGG